LKDLKKGIKKMIFKLIENKDDNLKEKLESDSIVTKMLSDNKAVIYDTKKMNEDELKTTIAEAKLLSDCGVTVFFIVENSGIKKTDNADFGLNNITMTVAFNSNQLSIATFNNFISCPSVTNLVDSMPKYIYSYRMHKSTGTVIWGLTSNITKCATAYTDNLVEIDRNYESPEYSLYIDTDAIEQGAQDSYNSRNDIIKTLNTILYSMQSWYRYEVCVQYDDGNPLELSNIANGVDFLSAPTIEELVWKFKLYVHAYSIKSTLLD
jgi:hypothetical protein